VSLLAGVLAVALSAVAAVVVHGAGANVQATVLPTLASSTQFDVTGFIQSATLDTPGDVHSGGTVTVNGQTIVIPRETIVILPANALTWQEVFTHAPAPWGPAQSGLALNDTPKPDTTYEVHVVGNRVIDGNGDRYIAGLVNITQEDLNSGAGYVNYIDYATGTLRVGGTLGDSSTGTRVTINDPAAPGSASGGRYGRAMSPDDRFQVDQDNPTILAETGFPMCIPRTDPNATDDAACPQANRPAVSNPVTYTSGVSPQPNTLISGEHYRMFRMDSPANVDANAGCLRTPCADPRKQAPFEIGDYITYAGNVETDGTGRYISAHSITASLGIYTQPGVDPAYVTVDVSLIGTGGLTVFGAGEAAARTRFEGMSTDETRGIHLYGVDINPTSGATTDRDWGTILPDPGPPNGAVRGRWRFRPPCTASVPTQKACVGPAAGTFIPPTREVRATIEGLGQFQAGTLIPNANSQVPGTPSAKTAANGIYYGQYHAPIEEYIFPENVPGTAIPENNFNTIPFLAFGGYASLTGVQAGVLSPWPSNVPAPAFVCATPTINGAPYAVANGGSLKLSGSVTPNATLPLTVQWTAGTTAGGTDLNGALTGATTTTPTFNATGLAPGQYFLSMIADNPCGATTASTTITVQAAPAPSINPIQAQTITAGNSFTITATSPSNPTPTWAWSEPLTNPANLAFTQAPAAGTAAASSSITVNTTALTPTGTYEFDVKATNANGTSSLVAVNVTVTGNLPTNVTLTPVEYRIGKQRLVITATSLDPTVTSMVLQPYLTETGTIFDPNTLGAANLTVSLAAPGSFTITAVGAPRPACNLGGAYATPCAQKPITVKAVRTGTPGFVGTSAPTALDRIRN
jgi:hypothetical protein